MLIEVVVGSVRNAPKLAPTEREQKFEVGGRLAVEAELVLIVISQAKFLSSKPRPSSQLWQKVLQYRNHSRSVPGLQKNSSSICSNSLTRKMKLPGVISFLKDLPIWPMPNGIFFLVVR